MIQGPIDYISQLGGSSNVGSLLGGFQGGINTGYGIGNAIQQQQLSQQAAQQKAEADKAKQERLGQIRDSIAKKSFTAADLVEYGELTSPEAMKEVRGAIESMDEAEQNGHLSSLSRPWAAMASENYDLAKNELNAIIEGYKSIDDQEALGFLNGVVQEIDEDPEGAFESLSMFLSAFPKGKDVVDSYISQKAAPVDRAKTDAEIRKLNAEALKMELEANRPQGTEIDADARKIMNTATDGAVSSLLLSDQADNLATAFDKIKPASGWTGNALELLKKATGGQDKFTSLKQEYVKLRNTDVLKNLPPGVASDKDIEIALRAFPDELANPDQISSFLKGTAKLNRYAADVNRAKAEWVNQNGSLGPARSDFTANKIPVKKGTNFLDFSATIPIPNVASGGESKPKVIEGDF